MDGTNMPSELAKEYAKRKFRRWLFKLVLSNTPLLIILLVVIVAALYDLGELDTTANNDNNSDVIVETVECGFTISSTALSKQEFKEKIKNFASKNSNFKIFYENAYGIYEYAKSKNVNPELVVIRAYVEGRGKTTGKYNYWGMGCTNTGGIKACFNYTSFDDGYTDYINNISKYK